LSPSVGSVAELGTMSSETLSPLKPVVPDGRKSVL